MSQKLFNTAVDPGANTKERMILREVGTYQDAPSNTSGARRSGGWISSVRCRLVNEATPQSERAMLRSMGLYPSLT